jgi:hypothetical protein
MAFENTNDNTPLFTCVWFSVKDVRCWLSTVQTLKLRKHTTMCSDHVCNLEKLLNLCYSCFI